MSTLPLEIFDETLRDGEQQAGIVFPPEVKLRLARKISRTGVHRIDLMPAVDPSETDVAAQLVGEGLGDRLSAATMLGRNHVDKAVACGLRRIVLFYAVSDRLLFLRDPEVRSDHRLCRMTVDDAVPADVMARARDAMLELALDSASYARSLGLDVDFAAEDASRADPEFLVRVIHALSPHLEHFMLCDTVGVLRPRETAVWVASLRRVAPNAKLAVHFHNDQGLALENTIEAVLAGAQMVSGTFRGLGERAGNVALERVLGELERQHGLAVDGIDYDAVEQVLRELDALGFRPAVPHSPEAKIHVSGIHVQALLRDPRSYSSDGALPIEVGFGKVGGASNFEYLFERVIGRPQGPGVYRRLSDALKRRAIAERRCYSVDEVMRLLEDGQLPLEAT